MGFSPWPAQDGLQRPGISGLGVGTEMAVLRQTRANEPAGGRARCTASDAQTAHHKNAARGNTRRGAGGCACPVLVGFVSSPAAGGAKKKSITPHGHFNAADSNRRLLPARPDPNTPKWPQENRHSTCCISAAPGIWAVGRLWAGTSGMNFWSCTFLKVQIQKNRWISRPPYGARDARLRRSVPRAALIQGNTATPGRHLRPPTSSINIL